MKFNREFEYDRSQTLSSQLRWYEGVITINHYRKTILVAIMPFNIILRWVANICYYIKFGE